MPQDAPPNGSARDQAQQGSWSRVAGMQAKLHRWAAADPGRRFDDLYNFVHDPATLIVAYARVAGNRGANTPGVDGKTVAYVEERVGVREFLADLRAQLKDGRVCAAAGAGAQDSQAGRVGEGAQARHPRPGGQGRPGRAEARARARLRGGLRAGLLRVPARAQSARRDRRDPQVRHPRLPVGAGRGRRGGLRQPLAPVRHGPGAGQGQGQARARAGESVPQGRGPHRDRPAGELSHRHAARRDLVPADLQRGDVGAR